MKLRVDAERIRNLRLDKSWSQEELAEISGLSLRTIQRIEKDGVASLESRKALAAAFDLSSVDIIADADDVQSVQNSSGIMNNEQIRQKSYIDHPAPSVGLTLLLVASTLVWIIILILTPQISADSEADWLGPVLITAAIICLLVLGLAFWIIETTYYKLSEEGLMVKWGPSVRNYKWEDFQTVYWRKGVFTTKLLGPYVTPCVRFSNVISLHRKRSIWPLNLTPNDPDVFLKKIELFAPQLLGKLAPHNI